MPFIQHLLLNLKLIQRISQIFSYTTFITNLTALLKTLFMIQKYLINKL